MLFTTCQEAASTFCRPHEYCPEYLRPKLIEEAGEISGQIARVVRGDHTLDDARGLIAKEIGDVLWVSGMWAMFKGLDTKGIVLNHLLVHPFRPVLPYMEDLAADIAIEASVFRAAVTRSQLDGLLRSLELLANAIGFSMHQVAEINQTKLADRKGRGVIHGVGDDR